MKIRQHWLKFLIFAVSGIFVVVLAYVFMPKILYILKTVLSMFLPFILGYLFSLMVNPLADFLQKKLRCPRGVSAILVIVFTIGIVGGTLFALLWKLISEMRNLYMQFPQIYNEVQYYWQEFLKHWSSLYESMPYQIQQALSGISNDFSDKAAAFINSHSVPVVGYASDFAKALPGGFISVIIFILSVYFMVVDHKNVADTVHKMLGKKLTERLRVTKNECKYFLGGYIKAQFILMCINFMIMFVEFSVTDTEYAALIALSTAFLDALPVFGSGIVLWPLAALSFISGSVKTGIVMLVAYGSVFVARHILEPKLVSSKMGINPLITLMSMYIGYRIWGVGGIIIGIILMLIFISIYRSGLFDAPINGLKRLGHYINKQFILIKKFVIEQMEDNDE